LAVRECKEREREREREKERERAEANREMGVTQKVGVKVGVSTMCEALGRK
jgi:hypothetical protein